MPILVLCYPRIDGSFYIQTLSLSKPRLLFVQASVELQFQYQLLDAIKGKIEGIRLAVYLKFVSHCNQ